MKNQTNFRKLIWITALILLLASCRSGGSDQTALDGENGNASIKQPTPTLHPFFFKGKEQPISLKTNSIQALTSTVVLPTIEPRQTESTVNQNESADATPTPVVTETPEATSTPAPTPTPMVLPTITVYDDTLNNNWTLSTSTGIKYYLQDRNAAHNGEYAIAMTPTRDYGNLAFTVKFGTKETYLRDKTLGVRFWLYSGDATVGTQDLAVSVVGSNKYPYWVWNDNSVTNDTEPIFSETRLQYLGFNDAIPPETWVQVEVWLDELLFDPDYQYVTGIYIKNGEDFRDTIWIDQVELVMAPDTP